MSIPKELVRITKGAKPRYQLYQPGFNNGNGCWLGGVWITLTKEDWDKKKSAHQKLYKDIFTDMKKQSHHDKGVPLKKMTPAQKQAWQHCSGTTHLDCMCNGHYTPIGVNMAGDCINEKSLKWMRANKYMVIEKTKAYNRNNNQLKGLKGIPEDLIYHTEEPIDTVRMTIDQNKARSLAMFEAGLEKVEGVPTGFSAMFAFQHLIELEEGIIRAEWEKTRPKPDPYDDTARDTEEYIKCRAAAKKTFEDKFQATYEQYREGHNSCARINVKNGLYSFVLPIFHDDGTHEPWTQEDVPDPNEK